MMRKKPMLAYPVSDKPIDYNKPTFIQPKLDGVRCVIQAEWLNPMTIEVKAYSRTGKEWKNINHILKQLTPFFKKYPNVILDGELYNHDLKDDFEKIISLVRKTKPTDENRVESAEMVQFHCYDTIMEHMSYDQRNEFINQALMLIPSVHIVDTNRVFKHEEALNIHHDANLANGYEGSILRTNDVYKCGRSWSLRKFKDFHDAEALLCEWVEGKGKRKGTIGKFMAIDEHGIIFGMPVMDKFEYLQENFEEMKKWVGLPATFTYFEKTKAGSYRHPLFKAIRNYE
jgi:ATP-dependent DNA ligase